MVSFEDNFAWTDASTSDTSAECDQKTEMNHRESKKTSHKKLYKEDSEAKVKQELLNGDIKSEWESLQPEPPAPAPLSPAPARKRKRERSTRRTYSSDSEADLHLLEKRVKKESLASIAPRNDHNHHKNSNDDSGQEVQESLNSSKSPLKKKKSKKSRNESVENVGTEFVVEDKFEEGESFIESRLMQNGLDDTCSQEYVSDSALEHKPKKSKNKKHRDHSKNIQMATVDTEQTENNHSSTSSHTPEHRGVMDPTKNLVLHETATKISDRIQFEDDKQVDIINHSESSDILSAKLRGFLKANPQLQPAPGKPPSLSQHEDIWLLNCPQEIDITSLQGVDISLDSKCKLKTNSQTYIGNILNETSYTPIYIYEHKPVVKTVALNGIINFRKRIPKAHYVEDNVIQNELDFIPLPETKQRHPLFGTDYKKAIKIPPVIKARLSHSNVTSYSNMSAPSDSEGRSKKKKKHKVKEETMEVEDSNTAERAERGALERKRRRSGHGGDTQPARKKKKKSIKQELSIGSWDSEKAIEENLFNEELSC